MKITWWWLSSWPKEHVGLMMPYIHLTYAGVTAAASGKKVFRRLIDAEKGHGLPLVAVVKPGNKSEMVARLTRYGFRPFSNAPVNFAYRWDPERRGTA
jgi:hypothetical protein